VALSEGQEQAAQRMVRHLRAERAQPRPGANETAEVFDAIAASSALAWKRVGTPPEKLFWAAWSMWCGWTGHYSLDASPSAAEVGQRAREIYDQMVRGVAP
jgi:hypothetical protein